MNNQWKQFLEDNHAQLDDNNQVISFGQPELERFLIKTGPVIASQAHQGLIKVSGEEAFDFLQGQLTNDLKEVTQEKAQLSGYCNPQGQLLALFLVFKINDDFYLSYDYRLKETLLKRLQMFVMRSKVTLESVSNTLIHIGFSGEFADLDIQRLLETKVKTDYETAQLNQENITATLVKVPGPHHRYEIFADANSMIELWKTLRINSDVTNNLDWKLLDIVYGIPSVNDITQNQFIAQFLNLDKLNGINFKKGCFPGQEVIARTHYRGKVTKRMLRFHCQALLDLKSGDHWVITDEQNQQFKLTIIESHPDIFEGTLCLAVATLKAIEQAQGQLKTLEGAGVTLEPLAYEITEED